MVDTVYREKYVSFLDLLGFSDLVRASATDIAAQAKIMEVIDRLKNTACQNPEIGLVITYFSDCIVISSEKTLLGIFEMLESIKIIAENLLVVDMLVRGGLTVGAIHHDSEFMFGPGMIEAYNIEHNEALYPGILVSNSVISDIHTAGLVKYLMHDTSEPDRQYVHYLIDFATYDPKPLEGMLILDGPAMLIRHYVARRLAEHSGKTLEKACWLEQYWNDMVGAKGVLGMVNRDSDRIRPDAHPFRSRRFVAGG